MNEILVSNLGTTFRMTFFLQSGKTIIRTTLVLERGEGEEGGPIRISAKQKGLDQNLTVECDISETKSCTEHTMPGRYLAFI